MPLKYFQMKLSLINITKLAKIQKMESHIPEVSAFSICIVTASPTLRPVSSYSLILSLNVGDSESPMPPNPPPPSIFDIALGKFFIKSSGEVKANALAPNGL